MVWMNVTDNVYLQGMNDIEKYVIPILNTEDIDGVGFITGHYLITAGHVCVGTPFLFLKGKKYFLKKETAAIIKTLDAESTFENGYDIAVFRIDDFESPLKVSSKLILAGDCLTSICRFREYSAERGEFWTIEEHKGNVTGVMGNFFKCDVDKTLHEGSSGSPIQRDGEIVGLLCGNFPEDPENRILYLGGWAIAKILKTLED